jgi:hypothetical protein
LKPDKKRREKAIEKWHVKSGLFGSLIYIHRTKLNSKKEKDISSLIDLSIYMHHTKLNLKKLNKK